MNVIPFDDTPCTPAELAQSLAQTAAKCIGQGRYDSAAWRLADALALLRGMDDDLPGIAYPTGRGAMLAGKRHD